MLVNRTFLDCIFHRTMLYGLVVRGKKPLLKNTKKTHLKQNVSDFPVKWLSSHPEDNALREQRHAGGMLLINRDQKSGQD